MSGPEAEPFICPRCGKSSWHPKDKEQGYCSRCHDWTGDEPAQIIKKRAHLGGHHRTW